MLFGGDPTMATITVPPSFLWALVLIRLNFLSVREIESMDPV